MYDTRVETVSGHPDHVLPGSYGSDALYKISGSDLDFALDHMVSGTDKSYRLSMLHSDNGSISPQD